MSYDKDEYEKLISTSPLFSLDKEKQRIAYKREALKNKMIEISKKVSAEFPFVRVDFYEYKNNRKGTKGNRFNKKLY